MDSLNDTPIDSMIKDADIAWTLTKVERTSLLNHIRGSIVDKHFYFAYQDKFKPNCDQVRKPLI